MHTVYVGVTGLAAGGALFLLFVLWPTWAIWRIGCQVQELIARRRERRAREKTRAGRKVTGVGLTSLVFETEPGAEA